MRDYDRDEYEEYYDYEDEGHEGVEEEYEGEEEEYEEEEPRKPTKDELEYLELRQKLKESIRKQMKKENGASITDSSARKRKLPYDNYGSFFGPSQPVIAQRVIQESKSLLENPNLASRTSNQSHNNKNPNKVSHGGGLKSSSHSQLPKVGEPKQVKAQKLKATRDYSFLLSDDAEPPAPTKEPPAQSSSLRNYEGRPTQVAGRNKQLPTNGAKLVHRNGEDRKLVPGGRLPPRSESHHKTSYTSKPSKLPADSRKPLGNNSGNGPGRPVGQKGMPSKMPVSTMVNKSSMPGMKNPVNEMQKLFPSRVHTSVPKQSVEQRKNTREQSKPKMITKQPVASSRPQISKPLKQIPKHSDSRDQVPKNKVVKRQYDDLEDDMDVRSMIRSMFNYNPNKFVDDDDDDDMEAGFDEIMKEEKRSSQIAKKEDEEQLRLIEEEEERERRRRMAKLKKRKLGA